MESSIDQNLFKKFVLRSVTIPVIVSLLLSVCFVYLILHLMSLSQWVDHSNRVVSQTHEALQLCVDSETGVRGYLLTKDESFLGPFHKAISAVEGKFGQIIELTSDNLQQSTRMKDIQSRYEIWKEYGEKVIELKRSGKDVEKNLSALEGRRRMDDVRARFSRFLEMEEGLRSERSQKTVETVAIALYSIIGLSVLAGILLAISTRRQLMALSDTYSTTLEKQADQNQILTAQDWLRTGQTELSSVMQGDQLIDELCSKILNYLAARVGAQVGAVYNLEKNSLKRVAGYALDEESESKTRFLKLGEGLVGQAAKGNMPFLMKEVPEFYMNVSSAIGSTKPRNIYIFPVATANQPKAVIELGFVREVSDQEIRFLKLVSEPIAISIKTAEYRTQLTVLLEEAQRMTEELQTQQEELRSNNEELEEQSNSLKQSQVKLESQQSELEQSNRQLVQQGRDLETQSTYVKQKNEELLQSQALLEQKARELEQSSQYKSQFLANMSHELRTPLNSTLILAQLLMENKRGRLGPEEVEFAKTILSSSNNLLALINDILDLSKVEAGKIDLVPETVSLKEISRSLLNLFRPLAADKKIELKIELDPILPDSIVSDRQRLDQILKNLLSNAIKFTDQGTVMLKIAPVPGVPNKVDFTVVDTGIGISPEQQKVIFDAFKQADGTTSRKYGGTGLGLTISRDLAQLLGGEIIVSSEVGKGSSFTLRLEKTLGEKAPLVIKETAGAQEKKLEGPQLKTVRTPLPFEDDHGRLDGKRHTLLVIEDDTDFAKILYGLSHELNFNCVVALKADEGIEAARELLPHAIILDLNLPDHNGLTVLDSLKMDPSTRHIPVHVISGKDEAQVALKMGAVGYLKKPVEVSRLKEVIANLEKKAGQNLKKVLVVEDDKLQSTSIRRLIEDDTVDVITVESAAGALGLMKEKAIDCMILDLHLPDMSGFALLEKMTEENITSRPPVIVYTGKDLSQNEEKRLQKYSQSIIIKGAHSPERLLSEVTLFLHQVENHLTHDRQTMLQELRDREKIFESKRILLVDDDVRNIFAMSSALEGKGATVETARNGIEAVNKVKSDPSIDLVLMDIMMPEMDGYEAMREIRKDERFAGLPIIAVTAKAMADDQEKCREAGANDYLAKPIDLQKLLSLLRVWMPQRKRV